MNDASTLYNILQFSKDISWHLKQIIKKNLKVDVVEVRIVLKLYKELIIFQ